ncbi:MAG: 3',5'-cyclic-AMP phosphodiesterase, partial [Gammaproteobacteria bacterium]|nr:3',5'-cyclic-AMP phosphodiesterase [Gammaproteobacteria bacterium]
MSESFPASQVIPHPGGIARVVQLTDTHLCKAQGGTLLGMDTDHSLQAVIDLVKAERPQIDLLLGTGDLSDQGALEAYRRLQEYFAQLTATSCWLPGNHDDRANMESVADNPLRLCRELRLGRWQVVMLDSQVPGEVGGELGAGELALLEGALAAAAEQDLYSLVCLHHQPVPIGCAWLDEQMVVDAADFFAILDRFPGVRGVLWGHVHQQVDRLRGDIRLMSSPSTCVQFAPGSAGFKADAESPGYRWLDLHEDGSLHTGVSRVLGTSFKV